MSRPYPGPSPTATAWLQDIMSARLDVAVTLESGPEAWVMRLAGAEGDIRFPRQLAGLGQGQAPETCHRIAVTEPGMPFDSLVAPGLDTSPDQLVAHDGATLHVAYDLPGLILWSLTRCEEIGREEVLDRFGRFPASASHAMRFDYLDRPVVDEWLLTLSHVLRKVWPAFRVPPHVPKTEPSHDVDRPSRYGFTDAKTLVRRMAGDLRRGLGPRTVLRAPWMRRQAERSLSAEDPANNFDWIMDQSEQLGLRSTFYFITHPHPHPEDPRYPFDSPAIRDLMQRIDARGHAIGLHPSLGSFHAPERIAAEAERLRQMQDRLGLRRDPAGARMHYLQWRAETTPMALAAAGLAHDATLGFADRPGFRAGTAHPYPWYDLASDSRPDLIMRPLVVMDQCLISPRHLGLSSQDALEAGQALAASAHGVGGTFTLLWHNDMFSTPNLRDLYVGLLGKGLTDRQPEIGLGSQW